MRQWVVAGSLAALVVAPCAGCQGRPAPAVVIPPGREAFVGRMLGQGDVEFPGRCRVAAIEIDHDHVRARYHCRAPDRTVGLELHPAGSTRPAGARTRSFAIVTTEPALPDGFLEAVAEHVRKHEDGWEWVVPTPTDGRPPSPR